MEDEWVVLRFQPRILFLEGSALKYEIVQNVLFHMLCFVHLFFVYVNVLFLLVDKFIFVTPLRG
jgi:hypothetical protein